MFTTHGHSRPLPAILSLATSVPDHRYTQEEIHAMICGWSEAYKNPRVLQLFLHSDIDTRHLYLDAEDIKDVETSGAMNDRFGNDRRFTACRP